MPFPTLFWIIAVILAVSGLVAVLRRRTIVGGILIVAGLVLGPCQRQLYRLTHVSMSRPVPVGSGELEIEHPAPWAPTHLKCGLLTDLPRHSHRPLTAPSEGLVRAALHLVQPAG
ncbi:GPGG-motif small membrane protein [Kribbella sp. NBC_01245]